MLVTIVEVGCPSKVVMMVPSWREIRNNPTLMTDTTQCFLLNALGCWMQQDDLTSICHWGRADPRHLVASEYRAIFSRLKMNEPRYGHFVHRWRWCHPLETRVLPCWIIQTNQQQLRANKRPYVPHRIIVTQKLFHHLHLLEVNSYFTLVHPSYRWKKGEIPFTCALILQEIQIVGDHRNTHHTCVSWAWKRRIHSIPFVLLFYIYLNRAPNIHLAIKCKYKASSRSGDKIALS